MKMVRLIVTAVAATALVPLTAGAASAAVPDNDRPSGAHRLTLGQSISEDTSDATTGSLDAQINNAVCGAPFTNASVWFTYTAAADGTVILDMSQSDFEGGFMVFAGPPKINTFRGCGPTSIGLSTKAGRTYSIVAFSDTEVNGGDLELSLQAGPPPPTFTATVDADGRAFKNGNAEISGTFTCTDADFVDMEGTLTQIWKRVKITGFFFRELSGDVCDGAAHPWKRTVTSDNGLYADGLASVVIDAVACGPIDCVGINLDPQDVTLHGPRSTAATSPSNGTPSFTVTPRTRAPLTWKTAQAH